MDLFIIIVRKTTGISLSGDSLFWDLRRGFRLTRAAKTTAGHGKQAPNSGDVCHNPAGNDPPQKNTRGKRAPCSPLLQDGLSASPRGAAGGRQAPPHGAGGQHRWLSTCQPHPGRPPGGDPRAPRPPGRGPGAPAPGCGPKGGGGGRPSPPVPLAGMRGAPATWRRREAAGGGGSRLREAAPPLLLPPPTPQPRAE